MIGYISKYIGFCFGVYKAVSSAFEESKNCHLYMYGEVVNNPLVINDILKNNVSIVQNINDIKILNPQKLIKILVRAHGLPKQILDTLGKNQNIQIIDKTCPKVKRIHDIVYKAYNNFEKVIIVGNSVHPEVIGINGWCNFQAQVIKDLFEAESFVSEIQDKSQKFCLVSQTTYNYDKYIAIYKYLSKYLDNIDFYNTICSDTSNRQNEVKNLAKKVDMIIIVGGKKSSNSNKLFELAKMYTKYAQFIESEMDLNFSYFNKISNFAICSGASTPNYIIENIKNKISSYNKLQNINVKYVLL